MKRKLLVAISCLLAWDSFADSVNKIVFEGLDRVEPEALYECLTIAPQKNYNESDIDNSLKALFKKDFFSSIKFIKRGDTLVIKCVERPLVDRVAFEGNSAASDENLQHVIGDRIGEGKLYSLHIIKDVLADMQLAYKSLGYFSVVIVPKQIKRPGNKIDVVFEINEGQKTTVKKIVFIGNKTFDDETLKEVMATKEEKIWRFWDFESHVYREDKVDIDIENLTNFYKDHGYPFFSVTSSSSELSFDKKSTYCTFRMEEGDKYTINNVTLDSKVENVSAEEFLQFAEIKKDSIYNASEITGHRDQIRKQVALKNHPFTDVTVNIDYDKQRKIADVHYTIVSTDKIFIEKIEIVGNIKTYDHIIRRAFDVHEGDALNAYKVQSTIEHLKGMEYFDDVQISEIPGSTDDRRILIVSVKEKETTAQVRFGLTVSDSNGFGGFLGFSDNNIFGTGRILSTEIYWAQKLYGCRLDLFDPNFFDNNFGAGINLGANRYDRKKYDASVLRSIFIGPYIRYRIAPDWYHRIAYNFSINARRWWNKHDGKLHDKVPDDVETFVMKDEFGRYACGELASTLYYDKTDNPYNPRSGYELSMTNAYAGGIGKVRYFRNELSGTYYYPLSKKFTFITNAKCGWLKEIANTRSSNRYTLGGDGQDLRGFDSYGVGPRDKWGNSVGGTKFWTVSFMVKAPLSTREIGINGVVFFDVGSAWGTKFTKELVADSSAIRASTGIAIEWAKSPLGVPLSFVFGFPLKKKSFDGKQTFTFTGLM